MRKPNVENKYNLKYADLNKLIIIDRSKISTPLFLRNDVVKAWCISESTAKNNKDREYGIYNDYWIGVYDDDALNYKSNVRFYVNTYGGMCNYNFKEFFDYTEIENEHDLEIQELLLAKINFLLDSRVLGFNKITVK